MAIVPINLTNKTNPSRYKQGGNAELLNCYVEKTGEEGKVSWAIYAIEGLQGWSSIIGYNGGIRAMLPVDKYLYFVVGTAFYRADRLGNTSLLGSMNISTTAPVYIERNRRATPDVAIVCDGLMYYYRDNATPVNGSKLFQVTDVDLLAPTSLAFCDGYFIIGTANNKWQIGFLDDAANWGALDYARADANPDGVVRVSALQRDAVIFGQYSTEFWRNTGAADFPFERVSAIDIGCLAPDSVAMIEQSLAWVAHDRTVRVLNGYDGQRISTHAIERAIENIADPTTISATSWTWNGHTFYALSSSEWTWVYDSATGLWHTRKSTVNGEDLQTWRIKKVAEFNNSLYAGDISKPYIYEMNSSFLNEAGENIKMRVTLPPVTAFPKRLTFNAFFVDMEKGVGLGSEGSTEDQDPEVILRWSHDGGYTFNSERKLKLGKEAKRTQRMRTFRLGQSTPDGYVFQIEAPTKTVRALYQCSADVDTND